MALPVNIEELIHGNTNGSPAPVFETDADCTYFLATLFAHPMTGNQVSNQVNILAISSLEEIIALSN